MAGRTVSHILCPVVVQGSARVVHEERLQAERGRADADMRNMNDRLRALQSQVDQVGRFVRS